MCNKAAQRFWLRVFCVTRARKRRRRRRSRGVFVQWMVGKRPYGAICVCRMCVCVCTKVTQTAASCTEECGHMVPLHACAHTQSGIDLRFTSLYMTSVGLTRSPRQRPRGWVWLIFFFFFNADPCMTSLKEGFNSGPQWPGQYRPPWWGETQAQNFSKAAEWRNLSDLPRRLHWRGTSVVVWSLFYMTAACPESANFSWGKSCDNAAACDRLFKVAEQRMTSWLTWPTCTNFHSNSQVRVGGLQTRMVDYWAVLVLVTSLLRPLHQNADVLQLQTVYKDGRSLQTQK